MSSLKQIMNVEEDALGFESVKRNRESNPNSPSVPESATSTSNYASPVDQSFHSLQATLQRQSSSSYMPHSQSFNTTASSPPGASTSRQSSNTSTEPMDSPYYYQGHIYGYGNSGSSAGGSSTPYMAGASGGDPPVKLTPITGRVSRAKKGQPVHICEICRPPKTFTRAEHLRRHQLSHNPPDLACSVPGCDKVFHRRDLLERHQLRHEQEEMRSPMAQGSHYRGSGSPFRVTTGPAGYQMPPSNFGGPAPGYDVQPTSRDADTVNMDRVQWSTRDNTSFSGNGSMVPSRSSNETGNYGMFERSMTSMGSTYSTPETAAAPTYILTASISDWRDNSGMSSSTSTSGSTYSTPSNIESNQLPVNQDNSEWATQVTPFTMAPRSMHSPLMGYGASYTLPSSSQIVSTSAYDGSTGLTLPGYNVEGPVIAPDYYSHTTVGSLIQTLAMGQSSEILVTAPSVISAGPLAKALPCGRQTGKSVDLLRAPVSNLASLSESARRAIPAYVSVYWDKVYSLFPIVHRSTLETALETASGHIELLHCAMAATATQFLKDKEHRINGNELHAYAWHKSKEFTQSEKWPVAIMHTVLLCEYYARFRGCEKESHLSSDRFVRLYQMVADHNNTFAPIPTGDNIKKSWQRWVDMESRRRMLAGCFLLDVHTTTSYQQPPVLILGVDYSRLSTLHIPFSAGTNRLWDAVDYQAWACKLPSRQNIQVLSSTISGFISSADMSSMNPFDVAILLCGFTLQLRKQRGCEQSGTAENITTVSPESSQLAQLFPHMAVPSTYLALHYTPLHILLSVSGNSWVFNKKILHASHFTEHLRVLNEWRKSDNAVVAASFAARALVSFLNLRSGYGMATVGSVRCVTWAGISDYWGVYVCTLICWAFSLDGEKRCKDDDASRPTALQWIMMASQLEPADLRNWPERRNICAVICLARDILSRDCVGGCNMIYTDAVSVLKKLAGGDGR